MYQGIYGVYWYLEHAFTHFLRGQKWEIKTRDEIFRDAHIDNKRWLDELYERL